MFQVPVSSSSDYVHDVSHNVYGTRLAMCTSAQSLLIWDRDLCSEEWVPSATISFAHNGPIWRIDWAHPEFGQIIASCSEDRAVAIWSERPATDSQAGGWRKRATLTDAANPVTDVQFAPRIWGLKMASCSSDGTVRLYHAPDALNLSYWEVEDFSAKSGCTALSWCTAEDKERLALACVDGSVKIFEKSGNWHFVDERKISSGALKDVAWAPNLCRENEWLAACGDNGAVEVAQLVGNHLEFLFKIEPGTNSVFWRVSWNLTGTVLAIAPENGQVQLWRLAGPGTQDWLRIQD